jgi:hypothetical protein
VPYIIIAEYGRYAFFKGGVTNLKLRFEQHYKGVVESTKHALFRLIL